VKVSIIGIFGLKYLLCHEVDLSSCLGLSENSVMLYPRMISIPFAEFYAGVVGVIWSIMWFFLVYNSPAEHPRISAEEREYIEKALNKKGDVKVVNDSFIVLFFSSSLFC